DHEEIGERSARFDDRLGGVKERLHRIALVAAGERVGRVDIGVACDAKRRRVGLARDGRWSLLADLAHPHAGALLSALIFLELIIEEENEWAERKRELCLGIGNMSEESGMGPG
ncbi:hypothetical protein CMV_027784, partial [Castanea mollissima]